MIRPSRADTPTAHGACQPSWVAALLLLALIVTFCGETLSGKRMWFDAMALKIFYPWKVLAPDGTRPYVVNVGGVDQFAPWNLFLTRELFEHHRLPLWNPFIGTGMPFFGSGIKGELAPTRIVHVFFDYLTAANLRVMLQLMLAGLFMLLFLSRFVQHPAAQLGGALVYIFSSQTVMQIYGVGNEEWVWMPLALYWLDRGVVAGRLTAFVLAGLAYGLVFVGGVERHFPVLFFVGVAFTVGRMWLVGVFREPRRLVRIVAGAFLCVIVLVGISAIRLFPFLENYLLSERILGAPPGFSSPDPSLINVSTGLGRALAIQFVEVARVLRSLVFVPSQLIFRRTMTYVGILPLILLFCCVARPRRSNGLLRLSLGLCAMGLVIALTMPFVGQLLFWLDLKPLYHSYKSLTYVGDWNFFLFMMFPLVTALVCERISGQLAEHAHQLRRAAWGTAAAMVVVLVVWLWGALQLERHGLQVVFLRTLLEPGHWQEKVTLTVMKLAFYTQLPLLVGVLGATAVVLRGASARWCHPRVAVWLLVGILAVELMAVERRFFRPAKVRDFYPSVESLEWLKRHVGRDRALTIHDSALPYSPTPHAALLLPYEIRDVGFSEPVVPQRHILLYSAIQQQGVALEQGDKDEAFYEQVRFDAAVLNLPILNLLNVRFVITAPDEPPIRDNRRYPLVYDGELKIYENRDVLPRALVVSKARVIPGEQQLLTALLDEKFDPRQEVLLTTAPPSSPGIPQGIGPGQVRWLRDEPTSVELEVTAPQGGYLVLADAYHLGWRATVDDATAPVLRANFLFRAVPVPEGTHHVTLSFLPRSLVIGSFVTLATLMGCIGLGWATRSRAQAKRTVRLNA